MNNLLHDPLFVRIHYRRALFDDGSELRLPEWVTAVSWHEAQGMHDNWCGWVLHTGVTGELGVEITCWMIPGFSQNQIDNYWMRKDKELAAAKIQDDSAIIVDTV